MGTFADAIRELADLLDKDFNLYKQDVCIKLIHLISSMLK